MTMTSLSTGRKLEIVAKVVGKPILGSKTFRAFKNAGQATAFHLGGILRQLWHEVTGFTFLALAAVGGLALGREYFRYHSGKTGPGHIWVAVVFTAMFGWFGISSFWRVRKKGN
ncbi:MAG: hypothetical protein JOY93_12590 [Acidobacteriales bacterium]|nr:hypothetical protein [Terriglobales bacterium]